MEEIPTYLILYERIHTLKDLGWLNKKIDVCEHTATTDSWW